MEDIAGKILEGAGLIPAFFSKKLCRMTCVGRNVFYEQKEDN